MEDVKWFMRKWGILFLILVVAVIAGGIVEQKRELEKRI